MTAIQSAPHGARQKILVVDDDAINRLVARVLIEARGYDVLEAEDGEGAVCVFRDHGDDIGLVLMDLAMPGMGGLSASRKLRSASQHGSVVPIVALTRHAEASSRRDCFDAGMNGFLPKPLTSTGIESIVCLVGHGARRAHA